MKTTRKDILFSGKEKAEIRERILAHAQKGKSFLDLYGNGENYRLMKERGIKGISVDDGRDFKNEEKLKIDLKGEDKMLISLKDLARLKTAKKHDSMWLDFCGAVNKDVIETLKHMPNIMENEGRIWFTLLCGRENILPRGTVRTIIDKAVLSIIKYEMKEVDISLKHNWSKSYLSTPEYQTRKKKGPTRMIVHEFDWKKIIK